MEEFIRESLPAEFTNVARIGWFFIIGTSNMQKYEEYENDDLPAEVNEDDIFDQVCAAFCSLLDPEDQGTVLNNPLLKALEDNFCFCIASESKLEKGIENDEKSRTLEQFINEEIGLYCMTMKSNCWPFHPDYDPASATGYDDQECLHTPCWRPDGISALWEECFHTITEACSRTLPEWSYEMDSFLGQQLKQDIDQGNYDVARVVETEGGPPDCKYGCEPGKGYDWKTAVNEWVHQIWEIQQAGRTDVLTDPQKEVLEFMSSTPDFPMKIDIGYDFHEVLVLCPRDQA